MRPLDASPREAIWRSRADGSTDKVVDCDNGKVVRARVAMNSRSGLTATVDLPGGEPLVNRYAIVHWTLAKEWCDQHIDQYLMGLAVARAAVEHAKKVAAQKEQAEINRQIKDRILEDSLPPEMYEEWRRLTQPAEDETPEDEDPY